VKVEEEKNKEEENEKNSKMWEDQPMHRCVKKRVLQNGR
jgi:hypothetical protein